MTTPIRSPQNHRPDSAINDRADQPIRDRWPAGEPLMEHQGGCHCGNLRLSLRPSDSETTYTQEWGRQRPAEAPPGQSRSTEIVAVSVWVSPLSVVQLKAITPLSAASVKKEMNGFAEIAGNRSIRVCAPLLRACRLG